jgi:hypothetical protein
MQLRVRNENNLSYNVEILEVFYAVDTQIPDLHYPTVFLDEKVVVLLDCTNDVILSQYLAYESEKRNLLHFVIDRPLDTSLNEHVGPSSMFLEMSYETQALAFVDIIKEYQWSNLALIYNHELRNL